MPQTSADWIEKAESALAGAGNGHPEQVKLDVLYSIACSLLALAVQQERAPRYWGPS